MRYGLPYKGSKNSIAEWIIDMLPRSHVFVDMFCGGGAVTHAALLSGKYDRFIMNDIDGRLPKLFLECAHGQHTIERHPEWITREDFHRLKDTDAYVALVWSFGNNGRDYIYGADIEQFKHDYHEAVFQDAPQLIEPYGYHIQSSHCADVYDRYLEFNRQIKVIARSDLDSIQRQIEIERLQRLQSLQSLQRLQSLQSLGMDYREVNIPQGALIYCDIPYAGTNCGMYDGFDHNAFYEWANEQNNIFISEYAMPSPFIPIAKRRKVQLSAANGNDKYADEYLFANRRTWDSMPQEQQDIYRGNMAKQLTVFDIMEDDDDLTGQDSEQD